MHVSNSIAGSCVLLAYIVALFHAKPWLWERMGGAKVWQFAHCMAAQMIDAANTTDQPLDRPLD